MLNASALWANCVPGIAILSCTIKDTSKHLDVCIQGDAVTYAYGPAGAPELTLAEPVEAITHEPWPGFGMSISETTLFTNGAFGYEIWIAYDKSAQDPNRANYGGVSVLKNGTNVADLSCDPSNIEIGLFALASEKERRGQCYDQITKVWSACSGSN